MSQSNRKPNVLQAILIGLAGAAATLVTPAMLVVPGLFAYLLLAGGGGLYALALALCLAGGAFIFGLQGILLALLVASCSGMLAALFKRKRPYFDAALAVACFYTALRFLSIAAVDFMAGNPAFTELQQHSTELWGAYQSYLKAYLEASGIAMEGSEEFFLIGRQAIRMMPLYMPMTLCLAGAAGGLFNTLLCHRLCKGTAVELKPMRRFVLWQLPKSFVTGMLTLAAGVAALYLLQFEAAEVVLLMVGAIACVPFAVQGASLMWYVLRMRNNGLLTALFVILMVMTPVYNLFTMAVVGVLEQFMQMRKRIPANKQ